MHRSLLTLTMILTGLNAPAQTTLPDSIVAKLNNAIDVFTEKTHTPGLAVAIVNNNDIIYSRALGVTDLDSKTPVTIDTRFPIMSITKTFTATMLMQMAERGIVGVHDKVTKYVPEYTIKDDNGKPVNTTLYQLASHTAGLPRNSPADIVFTTSYDRWILLKGKSRISGMSTDRELLHTLSAIKLDYPPYDFMAANDRHYSNVGMSVLGIALQRAAKTSYANYLATNFFQPLQMNNTGCITGQTNEAKGYQYKNNSSSYELFPPFIFNSSLYAGGLYSSAHDLCKWLSFHMGDNDKVLSAESKSMMRMLRIAWKTMYPYVMHEGSLPGYRSMVVFNPVNKTGWVILTNVSDVDFNSINNYLGETLNAVNIKKPVNTNMSQYAGTYILPQQLGSITITVKNDTLYSSYLQDLLGNSPMIKDRGYIYKVNGSNEHSIGYEFVPDEQGNIIAFKMGQLTWYKQ